MTSKWRSLPLVSNLTEVLGLNFVRRHPGGHYQVAWWRLIPLICVAVFPAWHAVAYTLQVKDNAYDTNVLMITFIMNSIFLLCSLALFVIKRNVTCDLMSTLDQTLEPKKSWLPFLTIIISLSYSVLALCNNLINMQVHYLMISVYTFLNPIFPTVLDLVHGSFIHALSQSYVQLIHKMGGQGTGCPHRSPTVPQRTPSAPIWRNLQVTARRPSPSGEPPLGAGSQSQAQQKVTTQTVSDLTHQADLVVSAVNLFNLMSSIWMLLRCGMMFAKLLTLIYYTIIDPKFFYHGLLDELLRSSIICYLADDLLQKHKMLEDVVWKLHRDCSSQREEDQYQLLTLAIHLGARPANIAVGSVGVLGSNLLINFINIALTYTIIVLQYRPIPPSLQPCMNTTQ